MNRGGDGRFVAADVDHGLFSTATPRADWLAGLLAADGHVLRNGRCWQLEQSGETGRDIVDAARHVIGLAREANRHPTAGQDAYAISVTSPRMVRDLAQTYAVTPAKSLTLTWPALTDSRAAAFLRGYIDGDGCVSSYNVGRATGMFHLSLVGTPDFIDGATHHFPASGRIRKITRARNLVELRFNGRHAWDAAAWVYRNGAAIPMTRKAWTYEAWVQRLVSNPPAWHIRRQKRVGAHA